MDDVRLIAVVIFAAAFVLSLFVSLKVVLVLTGVIVVLFIALTVIQFLRPDPSGTSGGFGFFLVSLGSTVCFVGGLWFARLFV